MTVLHFSIIAGIVFGGVAVLLMIPLRLPDRRTAMTAAFCSRFAIGFLTPLNVLPLPCPVVGALVGLLISLPDAIVTKAYVPILLIGTIGGALVGVIALRVVGG